MSSHESENNEIIKLYCRRGGYYIIENNRDKEQKYKTENHTEIYYSVHSRWYPRNG